MRLPAAYYTAQTSIEVLPDRSEEEFEHEVAKVLEATDKVPPASQISLLKRLVEKLT